jgi:hypothetical protein
MSLTKLSLGGNNDVIFKFFPSREILVCSIPAGNGNIEKVFFTVYAMKGPVRNVLVGQVELNLYFPAKSRETFFADFGLEENKPAGLPR